MKMTMSEDTMDNFEVTFAPLTAKVKLPTRGSEHAAGFDVYAPYAGRIEPGGMLVIDAGFKMAFSEGWCVQVCSRSGLAVKNGVLSHIAPGIIDSDYRGEVKIALRNTSDQPFTFEKDDRVCQLVPVRTVGSDAQVTYLGLDAELPATIRGSGGFGSTGR